MPCVAQNACVRFVENISKFESVSSYRSRLRFLSTDNRRLYFALLMFFKVAPSHFPSLLTPTIKLMPETAHGRGRSSEKGLSSLSFGIERSYTMISAYNSLPDNLRCATPVSRIIRGFLTYRVFYHTGSILVRSESKSY